MKTMLAMGALLLSVAASTPPDDAAVLRDVLARIGDGYCVATALDEPPFAGVQRRITEYAESPPSAPARAALARDYVSGNWFGADGGPLDAGLEARLVAAATELALRGDPTPVPAEAVGELNLEAATSDATATLDVPAPAPQPVDAASDALEAAADRLEAAADAVAAASPADHGRVAAAWLARGQSLAADCRYPAATLSAVAREGDFAFVDVGLVGAPLAGIGETWALQRRGSRWVRVARRRNWIA